MELRPWRVDEADRLLAIRGLESVAVWLSDPHPWTDIAVPRARIADWQERIVADAPLGVWAIVPDDHNRDHGPLRIAEPVGSVQLGRLPDDDEIEIGWYLHPDATGRGYASEAARALLARAGDHGVRRVWAVMWPHNDASARVATAAGMTDLGVVDDPWYGTDEEPTSRMFRLDLDRPTGGRGG